MSQVEVRTLSPGGASVGMRVRLLNGEKPQTVMEIRDRGKSYERLVCAYPNREYDSRFWCRPRPCSDFVALDEVNPCKEISYIDGPKIAHSTLDRESFSTILMNYDSLLMHQIEDFKSLARSVDGTFNCNDQLKKESTTMTQKLYQTKDGKFGTFLAKDSSGRIVLEMKGSGEAAAYAATDIEEVRPYTVLVSMAADMALDGKSRRHYEAVRGSVEVGDLVLTPQGKLLQVHSVDTKAEPEGRLEGRRLVTEALRTEEPSTK